jgi:hypothetical protein
LGQSRKKKQKSFFASPLFRQILGGGQNLPIHTNCSNCSKIYLQNYFAFSIILSVKERYSSNTIKHWK